MPFFNFHCAAYGRRGGVMGVEGDWIEIANRTANEVYLGGAGDTHAI